MLVVMVRVITLLTKVVLVEQTQVVAAGEQTELPMVVVREGQEL